jgi:hypothetical protein
MRIFSPFKIAFLLVLAISSSNVFAKCKTQLVAYPAVVYSTPVVVQAYTVCPCVGTWGSPSCNCPDTYQFETVSCNNCSSYREYHWVPGHWHDTEYEVYYDTPSVYPSPYSYQEDWAYTLQP